MERGLGSTILDSANRRFWLNRFIGSLSFRTKTRRGCITTSAISKSTASSYRFTLQRSLVRVGFLIRKVDERSCLPAMKRRGSHPSFRNRPVPGGAHGWSKILRRFATLSPPGCAGSRRVAVCELGTDALFRKFKSGVMSSLRAGRFTSEGAPSRALGARKVK